MIPHDHIRNCRILKTLYLITYEPVAPEGYGSAERYLELLQELMGYVGAIRPEYAPVVKLLSDGLSRREIAKELGIPKSTVIDWVKKIQELTLEFMDTII